jgi:hypothetical protein
MSKNESQTETHIEKIKEGKRRREREGKND